jgi:hypothetical protein
VSKTVFIVTHGKKAKGPNPGLTEEGKEEIRSLPIPGDIELVIVGTGRRFLDVLSIVLDVVWKEWPSTERADRVKYSPLCGSADSGEQSETGSKVILADETVAESGQYIGLIGSPGIDLKVWLNSLPDKTLLCAGREFLGAIGYHGGQPGRLYVYEDFEVILIGR